LRDRQQEQGRHGAADPAAVGGAQAVEVMTSECLKCAKMPIVPKMKNWIEMPP
jgi:hypothetical protein